MIKNIEQYTEQASNIVGRIFDVYYKNSTSKNRIPVGKIEVINFLKNENIEIDISNSFTENTAVLGYAIIKFMGTKMYNGKVKRVKIWGHDKNGDNRNRTIFIDMHYDFDEKKNIRNYATIHFDF